MADRKGYIGRAPGDSSVTIARKTFEPTGVQTDFTFDAGYDPGYCDVYLNGAKLISGNDYTASNGSTVGLTSEAQSGDIVEIVAYKRFNLGVPLSDITGDLDVTGNISVSSSITVGGGTGEIHGAYVGDGSQLTGVASTDFIITGTAATFNTQVRVLNLNVTGVTTTTSFNVGSATTIDGGGINVTGVITASNLFVGTGVTVYGSTGIVSATTFYGDGSNLDNVTSTTINNNADNRLISGSGTANTLNGESNLTFDGSTLAVTGDLTASDSIAVTKDINVGAAATITGALSGSTGTFSGAVSGTTGTFSAAVSGTTGTFSGAVNVDDTTDSTSSTSGALIVDGGLGVAKNVYIGAGLSVAGTLTYEDVTNVDSVGLITAKSGVNVSGGQVTIGTGITMGIAGVATFSGTADIHLHDNVKLNVGDASDLEVYHDGNSRVRHTGAGDLYVLTNSDFYVQRASDGHNMFAAKNDSSVDLYFDNSLKLATTNDGTVTTGIATATVGIDAAISVWTLGADGSSHYTFTGPGNLSATNDPTLNLIRGQKYTFKNRSGGHPFRIQSTANGSTGTQYNTGVTNNDGGNGTNILFDVPHDAPSILYYQCTSHGSMGGAMYISGSAYETKIGSNITLGTAGVVTATSFSGDGSNLTGISAGISTSISTAAGIVSTLALADAQDHKVTVSGITTFTCNGGTEGDSHTLRLVNSGVTTVGFSTYFLFPSGSAPSIPTADGTVSLISFTVHRQGSAGIATQLLAGASLNFS